MLWIDSLGVAYDAKAFANREVNGSALLALMQPSASHAELEELGIRSSSRRLVLAPRLRRERAEPARLVMRGNMVIVMRGERAQPVSAPTPPRLAAP